MTKVFDLFNEAYVFLYSTVTQVITQIKYRKTFVIVLNEYLQHLTILTL